MAKAANKAKGKPAGKKGKKPAAAGKKKNGEQKRKWPLSQLTWLAKGLLAVTLVWFIIGGFFATSDLMKRRASCLDWLVQENRAIQGYKRVFNTNSAKLGCSLQKLGLRGFMAEPPIYPDMAGLILVFGPPIGLMGFYFMAYRFRRGLILRQKKKVWAKAGPMDLDDFEDMRDLPSEEEIKAQDEAEAAEKKKSTADAMNEVMEEAAEKTADPDKVAKKKRSQKAKAETKSAAKPAQPAKPEEAEKPEEELSELDKILRQVDD